jgi:hypothetical protein
MDFGQLIPVGVATLTILGGFITYAFQRTKDRREDLIKTRRSEYRKWVQSIYELPHDPDGSNLNRFNQATNDLLLFASDEVMRAVGEFKNYMANTGPGRSERDMREAGRLLAKVMQEMRKDAFEGTKLNGDEIRKILPIEGTSDDEQ